MVDGQSAQLTNRIGDVKIWPTIGWFLLCSVEFFILVASAGDCKPGGIVYCYGDERDNWWYQDKIIFSFIFVFLLPLPHILLSMLFKTKRNVKSVFDVAKQWHRAFGVILGLLVLFGPISRLLQYIRVSG
jgi:hypothetical protein